MPLIQNFDAIATTDLRRDFLSALVAGIMHIKPEYVLNHKVSLDGELLKVEEEVFDLNKYDNIYVIGFGKGSGGACKALEGLLEKRIKAGFCIDTRPEEGLKIIKQTIGTHPYPSGENFSFSSAIVSFTKRVKERDLIIFVISGGGSALLCYPYEEECVLGRQLFEKLTAAGATIHKINVVRKHLSLVKGGGLARMVYPATIISLMFSDVPGNDLSDVASGPTVPDHTTKKDARKILDKYQIPYHGEFFETQKEEKYFEHVHNLIVCTNKDALQMIEKFLKDKGYHVRIFKSDFQMEAREAGKFLLDQTQEKEVLLIGGETFVRRKGNGKGGRNMEVTLGVLKAIKENECIISFATDGIDNTDAAGAVGDSETLRKAKDLHLDIDAYLEQNDSYHFFEKTGDQIITGHTGSNVSDIILTYRS